MRRRDLALPSSLRPRSDSLAFLGRPSVCAVNSQQIAAARGVRENARIVCDLVLRTWVESLREDGGLARLVRKLGPARVKAVCILLRFFHLVQRLGQGLCIGCNGWIIEHITCRIQPIFG